VPLKRRAAQWPWQALLAVILLGMAAGLWVATKRVNYEWRWERVPQYFAYRAEEPQTAPVAGVGAKDRFAEGRLQPGGHRPGRRRPTGRGHGRDRYAEGQGR
jgi:hypothetical protein